MDQIENHPLARRSLVGALLAAGTAGLSSATGIVRPSQGLARTPEALARERLRQHRTPNVELFDHDGRGVGFYDDVMKGRKVLIDVMYSVCSNVCAPATRNLIEARRLLGDEARDLRFVSMSLTPLSDTPQVLRAYKKLHGIDASWTFLTGKPKNVNGCSAPSVSLAMSPPTTCSATPQWPDCATNATCAGAMSTPCCRPDRSRG